MNVYIGKPVVISDMRGPCPNGFHVPLTTEWEGLKTIMDGLGLTSGTYWRINLHMPFSGFRLYSDANLNNQGNSCYYWSSSPSSYLNYSYSIALNSSNATANWSIDRAFGASIRCFKDSFEAPTSSWTVITGTLGSAGIFRNQTEGLISITSNGTTGYTIQDKNLGATTVYNDGDALSEANCGKFYQWGNNYGFAHSGALTTSSTQVDASNYGPGNYYSSNTFIIGSSDWSSAQNDNLRGGVSQGTGTATVMSELKNAYIGEVWTPTSDTLAYYPLNGDIKDYSGNGYNGTWAVGTETYSTLASGIKVAQFSGGVSRVTTTFSGTPKTVSAWIYKSTSLSDANVNYWKNIIGQCVADNSTGWYFRLANTSTRPNYMVYENGGTSAWIYTQQYNYFDKWWNFLATNNGAKSDFYINGTYIGSVNNNISVAGSLWMGTGIFDNNDETTLYGYISEVILENKTWTAEEVSNYYDITKSNYGL